MVIDTSAIVAIGAPSQPAEVASVVAFPASPYAVFITKHARSHAEAASSVNTRTPCAHPKTGTSSR